MGFWELLILSIGLSMDAFAVSICKGLSSRNAGWHQMAACGLWFGAFQAIMPVIGFFLGTCFLGAIEEYDHWVAFFLLAVVGINMLKEASEEPDSQSVSDDYSWKSMLILALATSIDALAVGISLAMAGTVNIWLTALLVGTVTAVFSGTGVKIGSSFGARFRKKAQICGGVLLLLMGFKILLEHLGGYT